MKRPFAFFLMGIMLLSLFGCSIGPEASEPTVTTVPTTAPATTAPQPKDPQLGDYSDGVYINEFIGIRCAVTEDWDVYSDSELAQLNGLVLDAMTDADLVEQLKEANVAHLFYATAEEGLVTVNVTLENLGAISGVLLDEKSYVNISVGQLPAALQSMGLTDVTAEAATFTFAGHEHAGVNVHGMFSGVDFYEKLVCVKVDSYIGVITVASYYEDITEDLLKMFTAA